MINDKLIRAARRNKRYIAHVAIIGRFVPGGKTLTEFEMTLDEGSYDRLVTLLKLFQDRSQQTALTDKAVELLVDVTGKLEDLWPDDDVPGIKARRYARRIREAIESLQKLIETDESSG